MNGARDGNGREGFGTGLLMPKHPVPGEPPILPQIRPEQKVRTGRKIRHVHAKDFRNRGYYRARHLESEHPEPIDPRVSHSHDRLAKYLLASRAREDYWHDHATDDRYRGPKGSQILRDHLRAHHGRKDAVGLHKHRRPTRGQHVANRLDVHPWALERLAKAERVYFAIEGTPKADAILSEILKTDVAASVFDVPSVTLWDAPELREFSWRLRGTVNNQSRLVVIVPDADWHGNSAVVRQALLCREALREFGVTACIAAPPAISRQAECKCESPALDDAGRFCVCGGFVKGVDDFLALGGRLDDLLVLDREAKFTLALHADEHGCIRSSVFGLTKLLGVRRDAGRIVETLRNHVAEGLIEPVPENTLALGVDEWTGGLDWASTPTLHIAKPHRYRERTCRLGDFHPSPERTSFLREFGRLRDASETEPNAGLVAEAVKATAARRGVTTRAIAKREEVDGLRDVTTAMMVLYVRANPHLTKEAVAGKFGVSRDTIERLKNVQLPPPLEAAASEVQQRLEQRRSAGECRRSELGEG